MQAEPQSIAADVRGIADLRPWRSFVAVAAVIVAVALAYWPTAASMVAIWARSETFTHGFLVVPAALWFIWESRERLASTETSVWWPGLLALAGAGLLWLAGSLAGAQAPAQFAVVLMVPCMVATLFGLRWLRVLAFPMVFLFFAVPLGEVFVPTLIDWTADFTVAALQVSGIPVYREGTHFVIPSGRWSVVKGCSGVRYLIASLMVGVLYAWIMYRSPRRRALFIVVSGLVPLVANWLRAYLIVLTGHLSSNRIAVGVDHLIYGWIFFGFVIALVFWIGARWREDDESATVHLGSSVLASGDVSISRAALALPVTAVVAVVMVVAVWPGLQRVSEATADKRPIQPVPVVGTSGWIANTKSVADWRPALEGPSEAQVQTFTRRGVTVGIFIGYFRDQKQGSELVNDMNVPAPPRSEWREIGRGLVVADFVAGERSTVRTATLRDGEQRLRVWHWYWLDDRIVVSDARAKLALAIDRLLWRSDTSAWVAVFTVAESDAVADRVLTEFAREMGPAIQSALTATAGR